MCVCVCVCMKGGKEHLALEGLVPSLRGTESRQLSSPQLPSTNEVGNN